MTAHRVFCGVGSNIGDRRNYLARGEDLLRRHPAVTVHRTSRLYETKSVGGPAQANYLNAVWELHTTLSPHAILSLFQRIEECSGRDRSSEIRWGPRTLDLDLLFYDDRIIQSETLTVPHPRLHERAFVLEPLSELDPDFIHPVFKSTVLSLLSKTKDSVFVS